MARTAINGESQIKENTIPRQNINITIPGKAAITKLSAGRNISIVSTGIDEGTGEVIMNANWNYKHLFL